MIRINFTFENQIFWQNFKHLTTNIDFICLCFVVRKVKLLQKQGLHLTDFTLHHETLFAGLLIYFLQITLIKSGWNELMILGAAYRSLSLKEEGILVGQGKVITMEDAHRAGLGEIFDRVVVELIGKMDEMKMVSYFVKKMFKKMNGKN